MSNRLNSFEPIVGRSPRLLLLGSMPSAQSLRSGQYYAHQRNHFWKLISAVIRTECPEDYAQRVELLIQNHIALWDSVGSCMRESSLDKDICDVAPNDISSLIESNSTIAAVAFNGIAARDYYDKFHARKSGLEYLLLPSSSPVPRRNIVSLEDKLPAWLELRKFII